MTVSEQIIQVLDALCAKFGIVIDWTASNVLPQLEVLCGKFIRFEIWTSVFWMVFVTVLLAACWIVFGSTYKGAKECFYNDEYLVTWVNGTSGVAGTIAILVFVVVLGVQTYEIIEAVTFPEKTLFDYVSELLRMNR